MELHWSIERVPESEIAAPFESVRRMSRRHSNTWTDLCSRIFFKSFVEHVYLVDVRSIFNHHLTLFDLGENFDLKLPLCWIHSVVTFLFWLNLCWNEFPLFKWKWQLVHFHCRILAILTVTMTISAHNAVPAFFAGWQKHFGLVSWLPLVQRWMFDWIWVQNASILTFIVFKSIS